MAEGLLCIHDYLNYRRILPPLDFKLTLEVYLPRRPTDHSPVPLGWTIIEPPLLRLIQPHTQTTLHIRLLTECSSNILYTKEENVIRSELPELDRLGLLTFSRGE